MITKGIRGAITVENNTQEDIKSATLELLTEMIKKIILRRKIFLMQYSRLLPI